MMDCTEAQRRLAAADGDDEALAAHLETCAACQAQLDGLAPPEALRAPLEAPPLAPVAAGVAARLAAERGPLAWLRSRSRPARVAALLGATWVLAALIMLVRPRDDLAANPMAPLLLKAALYSLLLAGAAWAALRPLHRSMQPRAGASLWLAMAVAAPPLLALLPEAPTVGRYAGWGLGATLAPAAGFCFLQGSVLALLVLGAAHAVDRGGAPRLRSVLLVAAAALGGSLLLDLHCAINYLPHLLLGHATIVAAWAGAAALLKR